ncbi:site-specific integrase [Cytobacillus horneckiae]|uniref:site-specific integrase n=1 Tax=Cytobacillus horneckiae TaxID=549687 RepID=UPI003D1A7C66
MASYEEIIPNKKYKLYVELGYDAKGKRKRRTKTVVASGPRQAAKLLREFENEIEDTLHLEDENPTFSSFLNRWRENYAINELSASTLEKYEEMVESVEPYFSNKRIKDINTFQIVRFFANEKKANKGSLEKKYNLLQSLFKYSVKWKLIDEKANPMDGVDRPKASKQKNKNFYDREEIQLLLELTKELSEHQQLIIELALLGGLRRGEIIGIASDVLDFAKNKIHIKRSIQLTKRNGLVLKGTKTEDERTVTLPQKTMDKLYTFYIKKLNVKMEMGDNWRRIKDIEGKEVILLFSNDDGTPYRPDSVTQFWNRFMIRNKEKIKRIRFHDLRHSSASYILSEGVNMKVVQKRLGHKNIKTTLNTYSHITEKDDKKASDVLNELL